MLAQQQALAIIGNLTNTLRMTQTHDNHVKILFRYHSSVLDEWTVETMWAEIVDSKKGLYKLDNIPFYGPLVATDDIIFAEYDDDEERLTYRKTVENSGNSVVTVVIMDKATDVNNVRDIFKDLGCLSERVNDAFFQWKFLQTIIIFL